MKIQIEREKILKPLTLVCSVVERRQTLPMLANVYLGLEDEGLTLTGTDLEVEVTTSVDGVSGEPGETTVTARKLLDICRALPEGATITLESQGPKVAIRSGRSRFTLQALPAADYPRLETKEWEDRFEIRQVDLKRLLDSTAFSMAHQDVRYYLNGLLIELETGTLRAVATDGHRLAKAEVSIDHQTEQRRQAIVPRKAVMELARFLEDGEVPVEIAFNPNHMRARVGGFVFTTKLIDGRFPDYRAVIAPELSIALAVDRQELHETLARTAILTNEKFRGIRLTLSDGVLAVAAHNPEQEEASDEIAVDYTGDKLEIGFNVTYLMDALRALPGHEVEVRLQDANSSCTVQSDESVDTLYLVMPMRL